MYLDVIDLRAFYYRTPLGRSVCAVLQSAIVDLWPDVKGYTVAGYGFALPVLRPSLSAARRTMSLMPGPQGVMPWPSGGDNHSVLVEEHAWPLQTGSVDRLVFLHGLETSTDPNYLLQETWRVLGPGGRAVVIVPNRAGLWSRTDHTPFGYGRPYSAGQLETLLASHGFVVEHMASALYQPPSGRRFWRKTARFMERAGRYIPACAAGGVVVCEVVKQVPAPTRPGLLTRVNAAHFGKGVLGAARGANLHSPYERPPAVVIDAPPKRSSRLELKR